MFRSNFMKRCFPPIIALLLSAALAFAQTEDPRNQGRFPPGPGFGPGPNFSPEQLQGKVTIQGALSFVNGRIAVKSGETTYYVQGLDRLFGFVDGLKEGAAVTLEGYAEEIPLAPEYRFFFTEKLVFNGREYAGLRPGGLLPGSPREHAFSAGNPPKMPGGPPQGNLGNPGFPSFPGFPPSGGMTRDRRPPPPDRLFSDDGREKGD
jgi:hypothetical protein